MSRLNWVLKSFSDLTTTELYTILQLRSEVFVVEQRCIYQDIDNKDQSCHHLMGLDQTGKLIAYARIVPPGISFNEASIGRVLTSFDVRRKQYGIELLKISIEQTRKLYPNHSIRIGAQTYLIRFYNSFGFIEQGESYDEDGIEHIEMLLN